MKNNNTRKEMQPKIVFRYKRELITFYNKSIFKFVIALWSILLIYTLSFFFLDREKFESEIPITILAFVILIVFTFIIYRKTVKFSNYVKNFRENGIKTSGKILDVVAENGDYKNPKLLVEYVDSNTGKMEKFLSDAVTGDPSKLLRSRDVDVYILGDKKFATNFKFAIGKQKPYGKRHWGGFYENSYESFYC